MKILYDYQCFMDTYGGISNCFVQLIKHLPSEVRYQIGIVDSDNVHLRESGLVEVQPIRLSRKTFIRKEHFPTKGHLYDFYKSLFPMHTSEGVNVRRSLELLRSGQFDVFHPTYFHPYFLPYLGRTPFVLTIHDMTSEIVHDHNIQKKWKRLLAPKAAHIVTVSENSKRDIVAILGIPEEKITVIYHEAPDDMPMPSASLFPFPYLLYTGQRGGYKMFEPMMRAIASVLKRHEELHVVCTGGEFSKGEVKMLRELGLEERVHQRYVSDAELQCLYAHARCFMYPSMYEGFGIPILEAFKQQCPVLLNQASCFPEIAKDAALFFHLDRSSGNVAEVLESFLNQSKGEIQSLLERQSRRLRDFSWEKSARQLCKVYECVADGSSSGTSMPLR